MTTEVRKILASERSIRDHRRDHWVGEAGVCDWTGVAT